MTELLENIKNKYSSKKIKSLCTKLQKKCSLNSGNDLCNLQNLAFWMYILNDIQNAIKLSDITKDMVFNGKYSIWDHVHCIWALKARVLREESNVEEAQKIINMIVENNLKPNKFFTTKEAMLESEEAFRKERITHDQIIYKEEIERDLSEGDIKGANEWRFSSMIKLIRYKEEGVYPDLIEKDDLIEKEIQEYINILKDTYK